MPAPTTTTRARSGGGVILGLRREWAAGAAIRVDETAPPALRRAHLVEREDVEPGDAVVGIADEGLHVGDELVGRVTAPSHQPRHEVPVLREVAEGVADSDPQ